MAEKRKRLFLKYGVRIFFQPDCEETLNNKDPEFRKHTNKNISCSIISMSTGWRSAVYRSGTATRSQIFSTFFRISKLLKIGREDHSGQHTSLLRCLVVRRQSKGRNHPCGWAAFPCFIHLPCPFS